jgi:hypothetical protein
MYIAVFESAARKYAEVSMEAAPTRLFGIERENGILRDG